MQKDTHYGKKFKEARQLARLTQEELAVKAAVQRCQISDLERGVLDLDHVHWGTLRRICGAIALDPNEFMEYEAVGHG